MPFPVDWNTLAICSTIAIASASGMRWLHNTLTNMETKLLDALKDHQEKDDNKFAAVETRVTTLEWRTKIKR